MFTISILYSLRKYLRKSLLSLCALYVWVGAFWKAFWWEENFDFCHVKNNIFQPLKLHIIWVWERHVKVKHIQHMCCLITSKHWTCLLCVCLAKCFNSWYNVKVLLFLRLHTDFWDVGHVCGHILHDSNIRICYYCQSAVKNDMQLIFNGQTRSWQRVGDFNENILWIINNSIINFTYFKFLFFLTSSNFFIKSSQLFICWKVN